MFFSIGIIALISVYIDKNIETKFRRAFGGYSRKMELKYAE